ncbi:MAG: acyl-CoA dehydrogenase family protein [Dehalococcoidia bacterium]
MLKYCRDARVMTILKGAGEIRRHIIAAEL